MLNRNHAVPGLLVAAAVFAGACSDVTTTEPLGFDQDVRLFGGGTAAQTLESNLSLDAQFVRIAQQNPGFGGYFYGEDGALTIVSTGVQAMSARLGASLAQMGVDLSAQPVRVVAGQYDFVQLDAMHRQAWPVLGIRGVVYTDADEAANRVAIGVENAQARTAVERALAMAGVPSEAVIIREVEPLEFMQGLRDLVRPVAGGLQINFPGFLCTLGFNVRSPAVPNVHGFVTNSHCTNNQWQTGNTPYWQPSSAIANSFIGTEEFDAPGMTGGACPAGRICRNSDAAGVRYEEGVPNAFARIYRTTARNSLVIDQANPMFNIVAEAPTNQPIGTEIHKVGRTTGWTWGSVTQSCSNTNVGGTNFTVFCQDIVTGPTNSVGGGDSGSGTFRRLGTGAEANVELTGILWGGSGSTVFVYSPMERVRMDNPPPNPAAPWRTFPPPPAP